jgi:hypothetical protein
MPRRKPDKVIENRNSLGTLERDLERDRIGAEYAQAVATGLAGIAQGVAGLGIGGGILLGAIFFKGEIDDAVDTIRDLLPNSDFEVGSPAWIASWGDTPSEQVAQDNSHPQNETAVDSLVNDRGETLAGQTPYDAYQNASRGRDAEYTHRIQTATLNMTPAQVANFMNYPTSGPPPLSQSLDGYAYQLAIRETLARNIITNPPIMNIWNYGFNTPRGYYNKRIVQVNGYIPDPMLDWAACVTYHFSNIIIGSQQREVGKTQIEHFMNWQP